MELTRGLLTLYYQLPEVIKTFFILSQFKNFYFLFKIQDTKYTKMLRNHEK